MEPAAPPLDPARAALDRALAGLAPALARAGFNVRGCLPRRRYDARVPAAFRAAALCPQARSALVLACGGRALFAAFRAAPEAALARDPLDAYTARVAGEAAAALGGPARPVLAGERRGGGFADFVALAHAAGLGAPSRLGLLLHPVYGPWLSIRAVVLTARALPATPGPAAFAPCSGCPAPCAAACHGRAVRPAGFDAGACGAARRAEPACALRCDARRACPVGAGHAYAPEAEAHHMRHARLLLRT